MMQRATNWKYSDTLNFCFFLCYYFLIITKRVIINQLTTYSSWIPKARLESTSINKQLICCRFAVPWWEEKHHPTLTGAVRPSFFNVNGWINTTKQVPVISQFTGYINPSFWQLLLWSLDYAVYIRIVGFNTSLIACSNKEFHWVAIRGFGTRFDHSVNSH